jgi:hypothetical protein
MSNLFIYGCSNSVSYDDESSYWAKDYIKWKGYTPKVYGDLISDELKLNQVNYSKSGTNNYSIFQKICETFKDVNKDDVVIIQWTQISRFRLVNKFNEWEDFYADISHYTEKVKKCNDICKHTISEILVNRNNDKHLEEVRSWEELLKSVFKNNKLLFWSPFDNVSGHGKILKSLETITMETNGKVLDPHFSENGHKNLSDFLLNKIDDNRIDII